MQRVGYSTAKGRITMINSKKLKNGVQFYNFTSPANSTYITYKSCAAREIQLYYYYNHVRIVVGGECCRDQRRQVGTDDVKHTQTSVVSAKPVIQSMYRRHV